MHDLIELDMGQLARLVQNALRDTQLADVVQRAVPLQRRQVWFRQPQRRARHARQARHPLRMTGHGVVAGVDHVRQQPERFVSGPRERWRDGDPD